MGTVERDHSTPKAAGVKANRTLNAVSDGAFGATPMNAQWAADHRVSRNEHSSRTKVIYSFVGYTSFRRAYGDGFLCRQ